MLEGSIFSNVLSGFMLGTLFFFQFALPIVAMIILAEVYKYYFVHQWDRALKNAVKNNDIVKLQEAIKKRGNVEDKIDDEWFPLMVACQNRNTAAVSALIAAGAKLDNRDSKGRTALMHAVKSGCVDIAQMLLVKGANANAKSMDGMTPLIIAARKSEISIINRG